LVNIIFKNNKWYHNSYEWHVRFSGRPKEVKVSNQKTDRREAESETARLYISLFHRFLRTNHRSRSTLGNCSKMFIHSCSVHYSHVFDSSFFFFIINCYFYFWKNWWVFFRFLYGNYGVLGFTLILALMLRIVIKILFLGSFVILGIEGFGFCKNIFFYL
jgi:hypothetical protein